MFDPSIDAVAIWLGLALAGLVVAGVVVELPSPRPPDATAAASTVDAVDAASYPSTASHPVDADAVRVGTDRLSLRGPGGTSHATFAYGSVTPASPDSPLCAVARGAAPSSAFTSPVRFAGAASSSRDRSPTWQAVERPLVVRKVSWEGVEVTLVCA
jgi:hypothetical protein